jgi:hypothetical protein
MASENHEKQSFQYQMPNLDIPNPRSDLVYSEFEDFRNLEILKANGIALSEAELLAAVQEKTGILKAAAAHTIGTLPNLSVTSDTILRQLLASSDDLVQVEAANALARHGVSDGKKILKECLGYRIDAYICPSLAAAYLAHLGDPSGFPIIVQCFDSNLSAVRMVACKQLYFFVPFQGGQILSLFDRALKDEDTNIQWQALVQLRELGLHESRGILESYVGTAVDEGLRNTAKGILEKLAGPDTSGAGSS